MKTKIIVPKNIYWLSKNSSYALNSSEYICYSSYALHLFTIFSLSSALLPKCIIIHQERGMYVQAMLNIHIKFTWNTFDRQRYGSSIFWLLTECFHLAHNSDRIFNFSASVTLKVFLYPGNIFGKTPQRQSKLGNVPKDLSFGCHHTLKIQTKNYFVGHILFISHFGYMCTCVCESMCFTHNILLEDTLQGIIWRNKLKTLVPLQNILLCHLMLVVLQMQRSREKERQNGCKKNYEWARKAVHKNSLQQCTMPNAQYIKYLFLCKIL